MSFQLFGAVLSGGKSSRMGSDKALLPWANSNFLHSAIHLIKPFCKKVIICSANPNHDIDGEIRIHDIVPSHGPVSGIISALSFFSEYPVLIVACDMPFLSKMVIIELCKNYHSKYDAIVFVEQGEREPLCSIYNPTSLLKFQKSFDSGVYKLQEILNGMDVKYVMLKRNFNNFSESYFRNVNTMDDYKQLIEKYYE